MGDDAIDEEKLVLCCALCCANLSTYPSADCLGCSGKVGMCFSDRRPLSLARVLIDVSPEHPAFPAAVVDLSANSMDAHASTSKHIAAAVLHRLLFPAMMRCPLP
eukprot:scaffold300195_cov96-Cyclotella_meneghiniana.AAC.3